MTSLSVLVIARNEEDHIRECLESCSFAQETIVIDDESTDNTVAIAEGLGAKVYHRRLNGDFGAQKTFAIQQATNDWVFILDADERFTPGAIEEIQALLKTDTKACYAIRRENRFLSGKATHGTLRADWVVRLMPKEGSVIEGKVHERLVTNLPTKKMNSHLLHYPYKDWDSYLAKLNKYTTLAAESYYQSGKRCSFVKDILSRPIWAFFKSYIINLGFLDGKLGFIFSVTHYFYTMMKYLKLYTLKKNGGRI